MTMSGWVWWAGLGVWVVGTWVTAEFVRKTGRWSSGD
jgi:hypothetical protein